MEIVNPQNYSGLQTKKEALLFPTCQLLAKIDEVDLGDWQSVLMFVYLKVKKGKVSQSCSPSDKLKYNAQ